MFVSERQQTKPSRDIKCSCITVVIGYNSSTVLLQLVSLVSATAAAFDVIHSYSYDSFILLNFLMTLQVLGTAEYRPHLSNLQTKVLRHNSRNLSTHLH